MTQVHYPVQLSDLHRLLTEAVSSYSAVFVLCDEHTLQHCWPLIGDTIHDARLITISSGEQYKTITSCIHIWQELTDAVADRHALLINLGGGVIGDMGGYAAACYKRGIAVINMPTTLLAMVDASVGGKTAIDFNGFKNHIGLFNMPSAVMIYPGFLETLDDRQLRSGMAEVVKHYLIADEAGFLSMAASSASIRSMISPELISRAVEIKSTFTTADPHEHGIRRALNFGHTIGHAIESLYLHTDHPLLHGEAVAVGMAVESIISARLGLLDSPSLEAIIQLLRRLFDILPISVHDHAAILQWTAQDKKNLKGIRNFALLDGIGHCRTDVAVDESVITAALDTYCSLFQ